MFDNSGKKIKIWAVIISWIGFFAFIILAISTFSEAQNVYRDSEKTELIIKGSIYMIGGLFGSYVFGLVMYGFGELVDHFCGEKNTPSNDRAEKQKAPKNQNLISKDIYDEAIAEIQKADDTDD